MSTVLFAEVKLRQTAEPSGMQGTHTPGPRTVMWTAGDRCTCCHPVDLLRYSSDAPDEAQGEMLGVLRHVLLLSPAAGCRLPLKG